METFLWREERELGNLALFLRGDGRRMDQGKRKETGRRGGRLNYSGEQN